MGLQTQMGTDLGVRRCSAGLWLKADEEMVAPCLRSRRPETPAPLHRGRRLKVEASGTSSCEGHSSSPSCVKDGLWGHVFIIYDHIALRRCPKDGLTLDKVGLGFELEKLLEFP